MALGDMFLIKKVGYRSVVSSVLLICTLENGLAARNILIILKTYVISICETRERYFYYRNTVPIRCKAMTKKTFINTNEDRPL